MFSAASIQQLCAAVNCHWCAVQQQQQQQPAAPSVVPEGSPAGFQVGMVQSRPFTPAGLSHTAPPAAAAASAAAAQPVLLHQLYTSTVSSSHAGGLMGYIQRLRCSAALHFPGVNLDHIPAPLLVANDIADVVDRVQRFVGAGAAVQHAAARPGWVQEGWVLLQDVEGLLQLTTQPVLWRVLGSNQGQQLVRGLLKCRQDLQNHIQYCVTVG